MKHVCLFIMMICLCVSCQQRQEKTVRVESSAKKDYLPEEKIFIDRVIQPARMALGNNQLHISCFACDTMVYTFSLPDLTLLNSHGVKGNGPEDFMFPVFTQAHGNLVSMWGYADLRKIRQYQVDSSGRFTLRKEYLLSDNKAYNQLFTLGDSLAFYNDFPPNLTLKKMDLMENGKELKEFHFSTEQDAGNSFYSKNKGDLCVSSKGLAYLYYYQDRIDFFDLDFNIIQNVSGQSGKVTIDSNDWQNNLVYYVASYAGENYLYAIKLANRLNAISKDCTLEILDWNGILVASYPLISVINRFVVDEQNKLLYGVNDDWPDYIYKIKF